MKQFADKQLNAMLEESKWSDAETDLIIHGYNESLAKLLDGKAKIPKSTRFLLASLLRGEVRLPDMRGRKNSTLAPKDKEWIEGAIRTVWRDTENVLLNLDIIANEQGKEPIEIKRYIEKVRKECIEKIAKKFEVAPNTIRQFHKFRDLSDWAKFFAGEYNLQLPNGAEIDYSDCSVARKAWALSDARISMKHPEIFFDPLRYEN